MKKPKILETLAKVPNDKLLHSWYGLLLGSFLVMLLPYFIALGIVAFIAIGKELYDNASGTGTYDLYDALYTVIPIVLIGLVLYAK